MPNKPFTRQVERRLRVRGELELHLRKYPGKRGQITGKQPDTWFVAFEKIIENEAGERFLTMFNLVPANTNYNKVRRAYESIARFFK